MRQISEARRHRALSLSERLADIASARLKILAELDHLDAEARAVLLEHNILLNLDAPTSDIPDELLAMIFGAHENMPFSQGLEPHFGALVSHVSHRWREIALSTPTLWSRVRYITGKRNTIKQFSLYISRSKLAPVDIYLDLRLWSWNLDPDQDLTQLVANHMGHCRQLCIENIGRDDLQRFLEYTFNQPAFILKLLKINGPKDLHLSAPLFSSSAPRLRVLALHRLELDMVQIPYYLPACEAVTHLCLKAISITNSKSYASFRYILGEMKSLSHLELQPSKFPIPLPSHMPLELPNLQFLLVDGSRCPGALKIILHNIRAPSLTSLSLSEWYHEQDSRMARSSFPSLQHLFISSTLEEVHLLAQTFTDIERLSYGTGTSTQQMIVHNLLAAINNCAMLAWPRLESIAVPSMYSHVSVDLALRNAILNLQQAGRPFRLLKLSRHYISDTSPEALAQLREVVEVKTFSEDWPRPFAIAF